MSSSFVLTSTHFNTPVPRFDEYEWINNSNWRTSRSYSDGTIIIVNVGMINVYHPERRFRVYRCRDHIRYSLPDNYTMYIVSTSGIQSLLVYPCPVISFTDADIDSDQCTREHQFIQSTFYSYVPSECWKCGKVRHGLEEYSCWHKRVRCWGCEEWSNGFRIWYTSKRRKGKVYIIKLQQRITIFRLQHAFLRRKRERKVNTIFALHLLPNFQPFDLIKKIVEYLH